MKQSFLTAIVAISFIVISGCGNQKLNSAVAKIEPIKGSGVHGVVTFKQEARGVRVFAEVRGLAPGNHGFHIHEFGDCTGEDGKTAGGHFNPAKYPHGGPDDKHRHLGDLGNIMADNNGYGVIDRLDSQITFEGAKSIIGRGLIIHAKPDDLSSQPTGFAGPREACGVIGVAK
ncbi:MAG: superoxide dismutase family protein [bacterium]|nr:superoxide dismutase family protein [bacterium]